MTPLVLTLIGDDKPGLVNAASEAVADGVIGKWKERAGRRSETGHPGGSSLCLKAPF